MKVRLYDKDTSFGEYEYCTITEFTREDSKKELERDTLMILMGQQKNLRTKSISIYGSEANLPYSLLVVDHQVHIEVHQRYMYGGKYRYTIDVDGVNYASKVVTNAQQYFNVKVYASEIHREACHVYVSDFKLTNFL